MGLLKSVKKAFKSVENHVKGAVIGKKNCERLGAYKELKNGNVFSAYRNGCRMPKYNGSIFNNCNGGGCSGNRQRIGGCNGQRVQNQQQSNFLINSYEKLVAYLMNLLNMQNGDYDYDQINCYGNNNTIVA